MASPDTQVDYSSIDPNIVPGKKYRFVVRSAEEAVRVIHERMGGKGRVLSVKQLDGQGLSRFLSSPKLEVISHIPIDEQDKPASGKRFNVTLPADDALAAKAGDPLADDLSTKGEDPDHNEDHPSAAPLPDPKKPVRKTSAKEYKRTASDFESVDLKRVLTSAGFDGVMLSSLENSPVWEKIATMTPRRALTEVSRWLRRDFERIEHLPTTERIAFLGTSGVGKTTALCKQIAQDVLVGNHRVHVLKVDQETANADDALRIFCEVMGVNFLRDPDVVPSLPDNEKVYVDLPGIHRSRDEEWIRVRNLLDYLRVDSRVLVINAVYEQSLIRDALRMGEDLEASHLVLTHLDELSQATRLWPIVRNSGLTPWFVSLGQNVAGDYSNDFLSALLERTFPRNLL